MTPTVLLYWFGFNWIKNKKVAQHHQSSYVQSNMNNSQREADMTQNKEANINITLTKENFKLIFPKIWWFSFNLSSVKYHFIR